MLLFFESKFEKIKKDGEIEGMLLQKKMKKNKWIDYFLKECHFIYIIYKKLKLRNMKKV